MLRDLADPMDRFWTIDQAAEHLKVKRATVEKYVREGLALHFPRQGGYVDRDELLAEYRGRQQRSRATRAK
jgi:predicted site-specific integrase-resolvase